MMRLLSLLLAGFVISLLAAEKPAVVSKDAKLYGFEVPYFRSTGTNKVLQSTFRGSKAVQITTNEFLINQFEMKTYGEGDIKKVQLIAQGPECRLDSESKTAYSSNHLQVFTVTTNFLIEGQGFFCMQSNPLFIIISNDVSSHLPKPQSTNSTSARPAAINSPATPENQIKILSDRFELHSNYIIYLGRVHVIETNAQMRCERLVARFSTNKIDEDTKIEQITAEQNVTITTVDNGQAAGDRADYITQGTNEYIVLTGRATWSDGEREGKADKFTFDHLRNIFNADGHAWFRIPYTNHPAANVQASAKDRQFSELYAEHVTVQMLTNHAVESILAREKVVITNRFEQLLARSEKAIYTKAKEAFELSGHPVCEMADKGEVRGKVITLSGMDKTNRVFNARGDAVVKLRITNSIPVHAASTVPGAKASAAREYLRIASEDFDYRNNLATFTRNVHADLLQEEAVQGTLECNLLTVQFSGSNKLDRIVARDHVVVTQATNDLVFRRKLTCDELVATMWPDRAALQNVTIDGRVAAESYASQKPGALPKLVTFNAGNFVAMFSKALTNQLDHAVAIKDVHAMEIDAAQKTNAARALHVVYRTNQLNGERVVYTATNQLVTITGNPRMQYSGQPPKESTKTNSIGITPFSGVYVTGANVLYWDMKSSQFRGEGPIQITPIQTVTNSPPQTQ